MEIPTLHSQLEKHSKLQELHNLKILYYLAHNYTKEVMHL